MSSQYLGKPKDNAKERAQTINTELLAWTAMVQKAIAGGLAWFLWADLIADEMERPLSFTYQGG